MKDPKALYDVSRTVPDMFEAVKSMVKVALGRERAGLMLGLADLGISSHGFVGAYFMLGGNAIILNRQALETVRRRSPDLLKPYTFYLLLHEYLHSVNVLDEEETRSAAARISRDLLGPDHPVTKVSRDFSKVFMDVIRPPYGYIPPQSGDIELMEGFDRSSVNYIQ